MDIFRVGVISKNIAYSIVTLQASKKTKRAVVNDWGFVVFD